MPVASAGKGMSNRGVFGSTPTVPSMLDTVDQPASYAFSLRRVSNLYMGAAVLRVRRDSDSTVQEFGFSGTAVDTAGILAFVGAGSGFIERWYDQAVAAGTRYWNNTSPSAQPRIVNLGVLDTEAGVPAAVTVSTATRMSLAGTPAYTPATPCDQFAAMVAGNAVTNRGITVTATQNGTLDGFRDLYGGQYQVLAGTAISGSVAPSAAERYLLQGTLSGAGGAITPQLRKNGAVVATGAPAAGSVGTPLGTGLNYGGRAGVNADNGGKLLEAIGFDVALSNANRLLIQASVASYYTIVIP